MTNQSNKLPFRRGAINEWRRLVLESDRMSLVLNDVNKFADRYTVIPHKNDIFNMFRMLYPYEVRVVIVAQSPYPGSCPNTQVPYACGPALLPAFGCTTTPVTLRKVVAEACRDLCKTTTKSPRDLVLYWISQGVMLLNASLTLGKDCPKYLEDHSVTWEEVMHDIVSTISTTTNPVFLLVGKDAWKFENSIQANSAIKVSHPAARMDTVRTHDALGSWMGSGVFSKISQAMIEKGEVPIKWII
jgi:uracil-DNA glycosylase